MPGTVESDVYMLAGLAYELMTAGVIPFHWLSLDAESTLLLARRRATADSVPVTGALTGVPGLLGVSVLDAAMQQGVDIPWRVRVEGTPDGARRCLELEALVRDCFQCDPSARPKLGQLYSRLHLLSTGLRLAPVPPAVPVQLPAVGTPQLRGLDLHPSHCAAHLRLFKPVASALALVLNHNDAVRLSDIPLASGVVHVDRVVRDLAYGVDHVFASAGKAPGNFVTPYSSELTVRISTHASEGPALVSHDGAAASLLLYNPWYADVPAPDRLEVQWSTDPAMLDTAAVIGVAFPDGPLQAAVRCRVEGLTDRAVYHVRSRCVFVFALPEGVSTSYSPWSEATVVTSCGLQAAPSLVGFAGDAVLGQSSIIVALDNRCVVGVGASTMMLLEVDGVVREVPVEPPGSERVECVIEGLSPGVEYRVRSRCRVGARLGLVGEVEQPWSGELAVRTPARPAPRGVVGVGDPAVADMEVRSPRREDAPRRTGACALLLIHWALPRLFTEPRAPSVPWVCTG